MVQHADIDHTGVTGVSGNVAADTIWDAKGDLAAGTGANTASKLTVGANDTILMADSGQSTGLKWVASQTPSTQAFGDAAAEGTADTYARGDHKHAMPAAAFANVSAARVETDQTQSGNNSYADLATSGPAVTVTVNTKCRVTIGCRSYTSQANAAPYGAMGVALSSGNTLAAAAARSLFFSSGAGGGDAAASMVFVLTGLTPGSTVFTAKYNQFGAAGTTHYLSREISVELLD